MLRVSEPPKNDGVLWRPDPNLETHIDRFADFVADKRGISFDSYADLHRWSVDHLGQYLNDLWDFLDVIGDKGGADEDLIEWIDTPPYIRIFPKAQFNIAENILAGAMRTPEKPAVISKHQDQDVQSLSGQALYDLVSLWQQAFQREGVKAGDHIALSTTNEVEADAILLAANSMGAILMPVGIGMGADMMSKRFLKAAPVLMIASDGCFEYGSISEEKGAARENIEHLRAGVINDVCERVPCIRKAVVCPTLDGKAASMDGFDVSRSVAQDDFLAGLSPRDVEFTRMRGNHTFLVNASSGTTGEPKVFAHGGIGAFLKNMSDHVLHNDLADNDVYFQHSKQEWMMWPFQHIAMATGATILKYNGHPGYPDPYIQLDYVLGQKVTVFGGAAALVSTVWARDDFVPQEIYDLEDRSRVRLFTSTGSILPKAGFEIIHGIFPNAKIASITGGTDSLSANAGGNPKQFTISGQIDCWHLGVSGRILNADGEEVGIGEAGEMAYDVPLISMSKGLLGDEDGSRMEEAYYPHGNRVLYWGDALRRGEYGFEHLGRSGNMLNPFGVAVGIEEVYAPLRGIDEIVDAMAVGFIRPKDGQEMVVLFVESSRAVNADFTERIRTRITQESRSDAVPQMIVQIDQIPKTQTGKTPEVVAKTVMASGEVPDGAEQYDRAPGQGLMAFIAETGRDLAKKYAAQPSGLGQGESLKEGPEYEP